MKEAPPPFNSLSLVMGDSMENLWQSIYLCYWVERYEASILVPMNRWGEGSEGAMILKLMVLRFTENRPFLKLFHQVSKLIMFKFPLSTSSSSFPLLC